MPRVAPTLYDFVEPRRRRVPRGRRGRLPHLRPPGLAARQPRPRPHQGARRQDRHRRDAQAGRRGARGRLGRRARLRRRRACAWTSTRRPRARRAGRATPRPTATVASSSASAPSNVTAQRQDGFSAVAGPRPARRPDARAAARARPTSRARTRAAGSRTTVHQNLVLRWVRDESGLRGLAGAAASSASATPAPTRSPTSSRCPGHRLVQARHHQLDGPQRGAPRAPGRDADHRPADAQDPHQDERLPERLQPAPHRQHRLLRRVDQGRRAHDPGLRRAHRAATTRAARSSTASA